MNTCEDCEKEKADVRPRRCPYAEEIHDKMQWCYLCDDCYKERAFDI